MRDPFAVHIIDDPDLQAEVLRAAHAIVTAMVNREPDELIAQLLTELIDLHPNALLAALGLSHVALRIAIDVGEASRPGFRSRFLTGLGAALAAP